MPTHTDTIAGQESDVSAKYQRVEGPYEQMVPRVAALREEQTPEYAKLNWLSTIMAEMTCFYCAGFLFM